MGHKIGEIFEFKKDWYQCVEGRCKDCYFSEKRYLCKQFITKNFCTSDIIFKKLEKVGEPYYSKYYGKFYQKYITYIPAVGYNFKLRIEPVEHVSGTEIYVELKQKEDMDENKLNLRPFDLQKAREGKPVCTKDGCKARIICFDSTLKNYPLVVLVDGKVGEYPYTYTAEGKFDEDGKNSDFDLMMLPEKKEGWVNIDWDCNAKRVTIESEEIYDTKEDALRNVSSQTHKDTVKIEWEE